MKRLGRLTFIFFISILAVSACNGKSPTGPSSPGVITSSATQVGERSAVLNGTVDTKNETNEVWFRYGTNQTNPERNTETKTMVVSGSFSIGVSGLSCGTRYYFRAVAQSRAGLSQGEILNFSTSGCRGGDDRGDSGDDGGGSGGGDDKGPKGGGDTGGPKGGGG